MDFNKLFLFTKVVENQGFSQAARQLKLSKSTISRQIGELETELDCRLLERSTRKIRLTDSGEKLYQRSYELLEELKDIGDELSTDQNQISGKIRIVSYFEFGIYYLSDIITEFMRLHPKIEMEVEYNNLPVDLFKRKVDILFRIDAHPNLESTVSVAWITKIPTKLVASREFVKKYGVPESPEDLVRFPCLTFATSNQVWKFKRDDKIVEVNVNSPLVANSVSVLYNGVSKGLGLVLMTEPFYTDYLVTGELVELLPDTPPLEVNVRAYLPSRKHRSQKVEQFLKFCRQQIPDAIKGNAVHL